MESAPSKKQKPLYMIFLMCTVLLLVIVVGLFMVKSTTTTSEKTVSHNTRCLYDQPVCAFLEKLKNPDHYYDMPMTATISVSTMNKPTGQVVLQADTKNHVYVTSSESGKIQSELLIIENTLYKKSAAGNWEQQDGANSQAFLQFRQKSLSEANRKDTATAYTALGQEPCGSLTCYKYQVTAPSMGNVKEYIFFDTDTHLLRKVIHQAQNTTTETSFAYTPVTITPPVQ